MSSDQDDSSNSDEYESSDGQETLVKKDLPSRTTRGTRMSKLLGEDADADAAFWDQDAWNADDDEEYSSEEEEADVVDADFDLEEVPDDEVHDEEGIDKRKRKTATAKRSVYQEPYKVKRNVTKARVKQVMPADHFQRTLRASTAIKSSIFAEGYKKRAKEMAKQGGEKKTKPIVRFTQEELLAEAIRTEVENTRSLNRLERLEEERRMEDAPPKAPYSGGIIRYHSKIGQPTVIQFINTEQDGLPENLFCRRPGKKSHKHRHHHHHSKKRKV